MGKNISANQLMVLKLFLLIFNVFLQLALKKSRQSDVVERLKPPVPERPKLVSRNLQTKDVLDENLKEENRERNNEKSEKDGGYHPSETKEIKIGLEDDERGILINDALDAPQSEMEPLCANLEDEGDKEEEESDDVNTSFLQNEGRKGPVTSVMVLPSINFSKEKELTPADESLRNAEEKITIEKEEGSCEGKEDDEEDISGKEVLCYAWQIAKGMVRTFSTEECFEQFSHRLQITRICLFPVLIL